MHSPRSSVGSSIDFRGIRTPPRRLSSSLSNRSGSSTPSVAPRFRTLSILSGGSGSTTSTTRRRTLAGVPKANNNHVLLHRLPAELLMRIFSLIYTSFGRDSNPEVRAKQDRFVRMLTHVCSLWRKIAHNTPIYWTRIAWKYPTAASSPPETEFRLARFAGFLDRSGIMPFTLHLDVAREPERVCARIWTEVRAHMGRCKRLWLKVLGSNHLRHFLPISDGVGLGWLEEIDVRMITGFLSVPVFEGEVRSNAWKSTKNTKGAKLRRLSIQPILSAQRNLLTAIRTENLESLKLNVRGDSIMPTVDFLGRCTQLEDLELKISAVIFPSGLTRVTLPKLRDLTITDTESLEFLSYLTLPVLEGLVINGGEWRRGGSRSWGPKDRGFISDCFTSLTIQSFGTFPPGRILSLIIDNPSIRTIHITGWTTIPSWLTSNLLEPSEPGNQLMNKAKNRMSLSMSTRSRGASAIVEAVQVVPQLEMLRFEGCSDRPRSASHFVSLLNARPELYVWTDASSVNEDELPMLEEQFGGRFIAT